MLFGEVQVATFSNERCKLAATAAQTRRPSTLPSGRRPVAASGPAAHPSKASGGWHGNSRSRSFSESRFRCSSPSFVPTPPRAGTIPRAALVNRLRAARGVAVVVVSAPAGYGKTTLLAEWERRDERPFAWLSLDEAENDPTVFLTYVAAALDRVETVDPDVFKALSGSGSSFQSIIARLGPSLGSLRSPIVVALDDVHVLRAPACIDALALLVEQLPAGSQVVLACRTAPALPLGKLRAEGRVLEIGPDDLSLTTREAQALLAGAGLKLAGHEVEALTRSTEGWPAGLYLAALSLRASREGGRSAAGIRGDDRYISDYFRLVLLESLPEAEIEFLTRVSVLDRMCGSLCDHVLERSDCAFELERLEQSNLFVVPLDHERRWYRFHHLFRDMLEDELERREPGLAARLSSRAADWHVERDDVEAAIEYAHAGGDSRRVIELVGIAAQPAYQSGRFATVERWLARLEDEQELTENTALAVLGAWSHALRGRPEAARRWAQVAEAGPADAVMPDGDPAIAWTSALRAALCADGIDVMCEDAETAMQRAHPGSQAAATGTVLLAVGHLLMGDEELGAPMLADAGELATEVGVTDCATLALATGSLLANARNDADEAEALALQARELVESARLDDYATSALTYVAGARAALRHNNWTRAAGRHGANRAADAAADVRDAVAGGPGAARADAGPPLPRRLELGRGGDGRGGRAAGTASPARRAERPGRGAAAPARGEQPARGQLGRVPHRRRAAPAPAPDDASLVPGDRRTALRLPQHGEDSGDLGLSEARRLLAERGDRAGDRARAVREHRRKPFHGPSASTTRGGRLPCLRARA